VLMVALLRSSGAVVLKLGRSSVVRVSPNV
jgi:hypothetical protein